MKPAIKALVVDLDGTVYLGARLIPGADKAVARLRKAGFGILFLSNKPIEPPAAYARKLTALGIPAGESDVINSTVIAAAHLGRSMPAARAFVIGERPLTEALRAAGLKEARRPEETDLVVVSLDRGMTYAKMHFAYHAARGGARVVATNPDLVCPMEGEAIVDAGAWIAALEALLRRPIDEVIGKPSALTARTACDRLGVGPGEAMVVGDRLETDVAMGKAAGMATALVLTGVTTREVLDASSLKPDLVLSSLAGLPGALGL